MRVDVVKHDLDTSIEKTRNRNQIVHLRRMHGIMQHQYGTVSSGRVAVQYRSPLLVGLLGNTVGSSYGDIRPP